MKFLLLSILICSTCHAFAGMIPTLKCVTYLPDQTRTELVIQEVFSHFPLNKFKYRFQNSTSKLEGDLRRVHIGENPTTNFEGENVNVSFLFGEDLHFGHGPSSTEFVFRRKECLFRPHFMGLGGEYLIHLKTKNKTFEDRLFFNFYEGGNVVGSKGAAIGGHFTVPGVFSQPIYGRVQCFPLEEICSISFQFTAIENGSSYRVFFEGEISNKGKSIDGTAKLENGSVFATFTGEQESFL